MIPRKIRTSGIEHLESRSLLAALGPPGGGFEPHFEAPPPRFGEFGPGDFGGSERADSGRHAGPGEFDFRPPPAAQLLVVQVFILIPIIPARSAPQADMPPILPSSLATNLSAGEGEGSTPALVRGPAPTATTIRSTFNPLTVTATDVSAAKLAERSAADERWQPSEQRVVVSKSFTASQQRAAERKLLALPQRSAVAADAGEGELAELESAKLRGQRKSAASAAHALEDDLLPSHSQLLGASPAHLVERFWSLLPRVEVAVTVDDGLVELLAAESGLPVDSSPPGPAVASAASTTAARGPVLELATAADAVPADAPADSAAPHDLPAVPLH